MTETIRPVYLSGTAFIACAYYARVIRASTYSTAFVATHGVASTGVRMCTRTCINVYMNLTAVVSMLVITTCIAATVSQITT